MSLKVNYKINLKLGITFNSCGVYSRAAFNRRNTVFANFIIMQCFFVNAFMLKTTEKSLLNDRPTAILNIPTENFQKAGMIEKIG